MGLALLKEIDVEFGGQAAQTDQVDQTDLVNRMVRKAQSGDPDAFEGVYRANVGRIHALCLRMSSDAQHAETLTQDVFVRAWQKALELQGRQPILDLAASSGRERDSAGPSFAGTQTGPGAHGG